MSSSQRLSHPSKDIPRRQPHHVTVAVAPLSLAIAPARPSDIHRCRRTSRSPTAAEPRLRGVAPPPSPDTRPTVADRPASCPSLGFVPLRGSFHTSDEPLESSDVAPHGRENPKRTAIRTTSSVPHPSRSVRDGPSDLLAEIFRERHTARSRRTMRRRRAPDTDRRSEERHRPGSTSPAPPSLRKRRPRWERSMPRIGPVDVPKDERRSRNARGGRNPSHGSPGSGGNHAPPDPIE